MKLFNEIIKVLTTNPNIKFLDVVKPVKRP